MLAKVNSAAIIGLDAVPIEVEVDISNMGLPAFNIVGLPDKAVEESRERVRSALKNTNANFPAKKITVNLAPADLPKEGPSYDLPIAIGILVASGQIEADLSKMFFSGELALDGRVRSISGILPQVIMASKNNFSEIFIPDANATEGAVIKNINIYPLKNLLSLLEHLSGSKLIQKSKPVSFRKISKDFIYEYDMIDIRGQGQAKRALEIAASGSHNVIMKGPPGAGKTLLARTLPSILPRLSFDEALEVTKIFSISDNLENKGLITIRPFRSPHHTTSLVGIVGGTSNPKPGELTLAHRGVLFLDEFTEFPRSVIEALRQPIEDGFITISRAKNKIRFPTKCMLIAAYNPCPCGYYGDPTHECKCSTQSILKYQKKLSGPILDRIDIHIDVHAVKIDKLTLGSQSDSESSETILKRVNKARSIQENRLKRIGIKSNSELSAKYIKTYCKLTESAQVLLKQALEKLNLSARGYFRTIKVAQTIADLERSDMIKSNHIAEALQYRSRNASS